MTAQFWTRTGKEVFVLEEIMTYRLKNYVTGETILLENTSEISEKKFLPMIVANIKTGRKKKRPVQTGKKKIKKPKDSATKKSIINRTKNKYKGVRTFGPGKFGAQYYDKDKKKVIHIGTFKDELLAAAAVQQKLGNLEEARRLLKEYKKDDRAASNIKVTGGMQAGDFPGA
jgi:hypothetical protein